MSTTPLGQCDSVNAVLTVDGKQLQEANCFYRALLPVSGDLGGIPQLLMSAPGSAPVSRTKLLCDNQVITESYKLHKIGQILSTLFAIGLNILQLSARISSAPGSAPDTEALLVSSLTQIFLGF